VWNVWGVKWLHSANEDGTFRYELPSRANCLVVTKGGGVSCCSKSTKYFLFPHISKHAPL
jgi:hypothetical protein